MDLMCLGIKIAHLHYELMRFLKVLEIGLFNYKDPPVFFVIVILYTSHSLPLGRFGCS